MTPDSPTLHAHRRQHQYAEDIRNLVRQIREYPELVNECKQLEEAVEGIVQPFSVAIFGRMKTGKSSILNALLGHPLTITGVNEATATINHISYGTGEQLNSFRVHWNDEAPETLPLSALQEKWTGTGEDVLKNISRTAYLELYSDAPLLRSVHIIDTPGTGSVVSEHEEIAQQFIGGQETDALIYVFSPVGRETDKQDLRTFRDGCLPSSSPYNSVALLHKWDALYWDNGGNMDDVLSKAQRLEDAMKGLVACVLPISAPLAFIAKRANAAFWANCLSVLSGFAEESLLTRALSREEKWNREPGQAELYQQAHSEYDMPWASFRVMLRHLYRMEERSPETCAADLAELSGFAQLEKMLDRQFFMNAGLIKQRQVRARVRRALDALYARIERLLEDQESDLSYLEQIDSQLNDSRLKGWAQRKIYALKNALKTMHNVWVEWDYKRREIAEAADLGDKGLEARKWLDSDTETFSEEQTGQLHTILDMAAGIPVTAPPSMAELHQLNLVLAMQMQSHNSDARQAAANLRDNLFAAIQTLSPNQQ